MEADMKTIIMKTIITNTLGQEIVVTHPAKTYISGNELYSEGCPAVPVEETIASVNRFSDYGDGTVTDNFTGLMWTKDAGTPTVGSCTGGPMAWTNALDYVACLNTNTYLGHNDWRLPNVKELESMVNAQQPNSATWLNTQGFTNVQSDSYWSSSTYAYDPSAAWVVGMDDGGTGANAKANRNCVWPVRGGR
jgi:hypothetical protein